MRGQSKEAWLARWRDGCCPIHGGGFIADAAGEPAHVRCSNEECAVRASRWPGTDEHHASFGWRAGPEEIRAALVHSNDVAEGSEMPGKSARVVRISYPLE